MPGIEPNGTALVLFAAVFAACCLSFFTLVGMFPLSARPRSVAGASGSALVLVNLVLLVVLLAGLALFAQHALRWTSAVLFGGLVFLFAPAIFELIPAGWRDSRGALVILCLLQLASLAVLQRFLAS